MGIEIFHPGDDAARLRILDHLAVDPVLPGSLRHGLQPVELRPDRIDRDVIKRAFDKHEAVFGETLRLFRTQRACRTGTPAGHRPCLSRPGHLFHAYPPDMSSP